MGMNESVIICWEFVFLQLEIFCVFLIRSLYALWEGNFCFHWFKQVFSYFYDRFEKFIIVNIEIYI